MTMLEASSHLSADVLAGWDVTQGPTGTVDKVATSTAEDGDTAYAFEIAGRSYPVHEHAPPWLAGLAVLLGALAIVLFRRVGT